MIPAGKGFRRLAFLPSRPFACRLWPVGPQCERGGRTLIQLCVRPLFLCLSGCRPCVAGLRCGLPCPVGAVAAATVAIGRSWHWLLWRAVIVNLLWCVCHRAACKKAGARWLCFMSCHSCRAPVCPGSCHLCVKARHGCDMVMLCLVSCRPGCAACLTVRQGAAAPVRALAGGTAQACHSFCRKSLGLRPVFILNFAEK